MTLAEAMLAGMERAARVADLRPTWTPNDGPQRAAYDSLADELFYGGAAGGGKTNLIVGVAATCHLKSIIFRREFPQLAEVEDQLKEVMGQAGRYNHSSHVGFLPGRRIELASIQHEKDVEKYQGRPHDLIGFDEAPQFSRYQFQFVIGWNRTKARGQRCRIILAGNPPTTPEGRWIIEEFAPWLDEEFPEPAEPGDLRWYMRLPNPAKPTERILHWFKEKPEPMPDPEVPTEMVEARSRTFIPARLEDNPMLRETGYRSVLQSMPEPLRSQLLYGDMNAGTRDDDWQVIPTDWLRLAFERYRKMEKVRPGPPLVDGKPTPMDAMGVDVARGGSDDTTLAPKYGGWFAAMEVHAGTSTPNGHDVARLVIARLAKEPNQAESVPKGRRPAVRIDPIGVGTSPTDLLGGYGANVQAVDVRTATDERDRTGLLQFANVRAAMWWKLREALDPDRGDSLAICPDNKLLADLCAVHWEPIPGGIRLEPKEATAKRIGRSPDRGDALVMAHYQPARPRGGVIV